MKITHFMYTIFFLSTTTPSFCDSVAHEQIFNPDGTTQIKITLNLNENDYIYTDSISVSIDHPDIILKEWTVKNNPIEQYDSLFKEKKSIVKQTCTIEALIRYKKSNIQNEFLFLQYYQRSKKEFIQHFFPLKTMFVSTEKTKKDNFSNKLNMQLISDVEKKKLHEKNILDDLYRISGSIIIEYPWIMYICYFLISLLLGITPLSYPSISLIATILIRYKFYHSALVRSVYFLFHILTTVIISYALFLISPLFSTHTYPKLYILLVCALFYFGFSLLQEKNSSGKEYIKKNLSPKLYGFVMSLIYIGMQCSIIQYIYSTFYTFSWQELCFCTLTVSLPIYALLMYGTQQKKRSSNWHLQIIKLYNQIRFHTGYLALIYCIYFGYWLSLYTYNSMVYIYTPSLFFIGYDYLQHADSCAPFSFWKYLSRFIGIVLIIIFVYAAFESYKIYCIV